MALATNTILDSMEWAKRFNFNRSLSPGVRVVDPAVKLARITVAFAIEQLVPAYLVCGQRGVARQIGIRISIEGRHPVIARGKEGTAPSD